MFWRQCITPVFIAPCCTRLRFGVAKWNLIALVATCYDSLPTVFLGSQHSGIYCPMPTKMVLDTEFQSVEMVAVRRTTLVCKFWNGIRPIPLGTMVSVIERRSRRFRFHDLQVCRQSLHSFLYSSVVLWNSGEESAHESWSGHFTAYL